MKASLSAITATVLLSAVASAAGHEGKHLHAHLHEKKSEPAPAENASCECTTIWSTWYGQATLAPAVLPASTKTSTSSTHPPPPPTTSKAAPTYSAAPPVYTKSSTVEKPKPKPKPSSTPPKSVGGGSKWAMTYSAYQGTSKSDSNCKSSSQVMEDVGSIASKGFKTLRIYATDCQHLENVGAAAKAHGLKLIIGIYIDGSGISSNAYEQLKDITNYFKGDYSMVEMALVGNEALFNGFCTASDLASFISEVKETLKSDGYSGPVSTADTVTAILDNEDALCGSLDVLGANIHPFFNGNVQPDGACDFVEQQMKMLGAACGGKLETYNTETGWPSAGPAYMNSVAGTSEQAAAIASLSSCSCAGNNVFFSFENDGWKDDGSDSVEPYWGCGSVFD